MNKKTIAKWACKKAAWCILLAGSLHSHAQTDSSSYSRVLHADTAVKDKVTLVHIYDTSQNFFTWKKYLNQPYEQSKITSRASLEKEVDELKKQDPFWYLSGAASSKGTGGKVRYRRAAQDSLAQQQKNHADAGQVMEEEDPLHLPGWIATLFRTVMIALFLLAVGYFLLANKIGFFYRSRTAAEAANVEAADLFALPYQQLLQKARAEKDYRLAVRILYLQTLKLLSEKNIILFKPDYTNMEYLEQLASTRFYQDFFAVTRHYDYVWYGGFAVSESAFHTIQEQFLFFQNKIGHS